jgi:hypothetical protein
MGRTYIFKVANVAGHAAEIAGLGILAAPSIYHKATGKEVKKSTTHNAELLGLGTLAAPSAYALGKHIMQKHAGPAQIAAMQDVQKRMQALVKPKMPKLAQAQYDAFFDELEKISADQFEKEAVFKEIKQGLQRVGKVIAGGAAQAGGAARYVPPHVANPEFRRDALLNARTQMAQGSAPITKGRPIGTGNASLAAPAAASAPAAQAAVTPNVANYRVAPSQQRRRAATPGAAFGAASPRAIALP